MRDEERNYTGVIAELAGRAHERNAKLYVGNLDASVNDEDLKILFGHAGACESASVKVDRITGRSRGFAYVEMASAEDVQSAIRQLDGRDLKGRAVTVRAPQERENGKGGRGGWYRR